MRYIRIADTERFRIDGIPLFVFSAENIVNFVDKKLLEQDTRIFATDGRVFSAGQLITIPYNTEGGAGNEQTPT